MNCQHSRLFTTLLLVAAVTSPAAGQQPAPAPTSTAPAAQPPAPQPPRPPQRPQVQSPVVEGDKATFAVYAPKATEVKLSSGEIDRLVPGPNKAFTKGDNGVWSLSVSPLPPGIYDYGINIDGLTIADPESPHVFGNVRGARGFVEVAGAGGSPRRDEWRAVPHGTVTAHWYDSKVTNSRRRVHVYTPPGYATGAKRYPVLYLLHGSGDNDSHWSMFGRANVIADNLLADGKAAPMVIVMTDGHAYRAQQNEAGGRETAMRMFEGDLMSEVTPLIEKTYRVETTRARRAIAGLSMGGGQALNVGLAHPDRYAYIGAFSSATGGVEPLVQGLAKNAAAFNKDSRLLWIRIGKDDFLLQQNRALVASLKTAGITHEYEEVDGAHMWTVWRIALADFLPRLFKPAPATAPTASLQPEAGR